ncbi:PREDICTED: zinc transporter ZIP3-like [Nicrophorus vespilloides]|uniref:Zinc transporter ZIP3-like n=1 Tax=Nicrophorus vespilloides TaxID=110193 RepID=A0ABM1MCK6_NICVS|nr:PREDICTED: zinc transporter ZIP3-like [Nicrophorus vespilloides]
MDLRDTKVLVACLFGVVRFFFGVLPIKIYKLLKLKDEEDGNTETFVNERRHKQIHWGLALFQAFGGGVIFATCFLHMIPEVYESTIELKKFGLINSQYPFSQLIVSLGFFLIYFIEELGQYFISRLPEEPCESKNNQVAPEVTVVEDLAIEKELDITLEKSKEFEQVEELDKLIDSKAMTQQQIIRGILIVLALSLHAFFEGLAIGLQTSISNIWYLFLAISIHSATILFCIGLELLLANTKIRTIIVHVSILSITSPLGVFFGLLITLNADMNTKAKTIWVMLIEGLSAGTILYITFFEVLNREKERRVYRMSRACFIILGFGLMACLECWEMNV